MDGIKSIQLIRMVNYWIFTVNDDEVNGILKKGIKIYSQRMKDRFWGINENAQNIRRIRSGDKIIYYLAGREGKVFIGTATLASEFFELSEEDKKNFWHGTYFRPTHGVKLKEVEIWETKKSIYPLLEKFGLKKNSNWGYYFHHSIIPISSTVYDSLIASKKSIIQLPKARLFSNTRLKVIEDKSEIARVQGLLVKKLDQIADKFGEISVGYQGGGDRQKATWSKKLNIWWITSTSGNRFWNAFGTAARALIV